MKFSPIPIEEAVGKILGHNIADGNGRRLFRKGRELSADDITILKELGRAELYVAELTSTDIEENEAAQQVTDAVMGHGLSYVGPATGRVNLKSDVLGVLRVDANRLLRLNSQLGITLATLPTNTAVSVGKTVGTVKVIPFAVSETAVMAVETIAQEGRAIIKVDRLPYKSVSVILSGSPATQERILKSFQPSLAKRVDALGSIINHFQFIPLEDEAGEIALAQAIQAQIESGAGLIILAGDTAIMDRHDIAPRAVERADGVVTCFGAPVDPGNLLMLAYSGHVPILGAPGCVRSPKPNIVDKVLPRLLVGDRLTQADIVALGHGGLLEDVVERPYPRGKLDRDA